MQDALEKQEFNIEEIFTANKDLLSNNQLNYVDYKEMDGKSGKYYVIMPFILPDGGKFQRDILNKFGYKDRLDYFFFIEQTKTFSFKEVGKFADKYGNSIECSRPNTTIKIENGENNSIIVKSGSKPFDNLYITVKGNNNAIFIDLDCAFYGNNSIKVMGDSSIYIDSECKFINAKISQFAHGFLHVQEKCTFADDLIISSHAFSKIIISKDAMFSYDVVIQTGDGHSIFDVKTSQNINSNLHNRTDDGFLTELYMGEHVWVGRQAMILSGMGKTEIGNGSIIGARALVKGCVPNNCIVAGIPAKIIKRDIAWSRTNMSEDIGHCGEYANYTDFKQK